MFVRVEGMRLGSAEGLAQQQLESFLLFSSSVFSPMARWFLHLSQLLHFFPLQNKSNISTISTIDNCGLQVFQLYYVTDISSNSYKSCPTVYLYIKMSENAPHLLIIERFFNV